MRKMAIWPLADDNDPEEIASIISHFLFYPVRTLIPISPASGLLILLYNGQYTSCTSDYPTLYFS